MNRIGVAVLREKPWRVNELEDRLTHCMMVDKALHGGVFYASAPNYACSMARFHLGLQNRNQKFRDMVADQVVGIGHAKDRETALKYLKDSPVLLYEEKYLVYFPLNKKPVEPDVVICIGRPKEVMELIHRITADTGERLEVKVSGVSALCSEATAIPLLTGKPNLSLGCCGSRASGKMRDNEMVIGLPPGYFKYLK